MAFSIVSYFANRGKTKVAWPTWLELEIIPPRLGISVFVALFLGAADIGFSALFRLVTSGMAKQVLNKVVAGTCFTYSATKKMFLVTSVTY
jgi:hypothetical protein